MDATDGSGSEPLAPRFYDPANITVTDDFEVKGLTKEQGVALFSAKSLGTKYYTDLLATGGRSSEYSQEELALVTDDDFRPIVELYASDEEALLLAFSEAWTYMMTADRFKVSSCRVSRLRTRNVSKLIGLRSIFEYRTTARMPVTELAFRISKENLLWVSRLLCLPVCPVQLLATRTVW